HEHIGGPDKEASDELDKHCRRTEGNSATIPWETLYLRTMQTRADIVATSSAGGYLVEALNYPSAAGALLALLTLGQLGATAINSKANLNLPKITADASTYWLATEESTITESDLTTGQVAFTPHNLGGYTEFSRLMFLQSSPDVVNTFARELVRKQKRSIESA